MREYAVSEVDNRRILVALVCDRCDRKIKPYAGIANSGWVKYGQVGPSPGDEMEWTLCPQCARGVP